MDREKIEVLAAIILAGSLSAGTDTNGFSGELTVRASVDKALAIVQEVADQCEYMRTG